MYHNMANLEDKVSCENVWECAIKCYEFSKYLDLVQRRKNILLILTKVLMYCDAPYNRPGGSVLLNLGAELLFELKRNPRVKEQLAILDTSWHYKRETVSLI